MSLARLFFPAIFCVSAAGLSVSESAHAGEVAAPQACAKTSAVRDIKDAAKRIECLGASRRLWIVGEIHGTRETPQLVEALVDQQSAKGNVTLALEIPTFEQPALDAYLASAGSAADRNKWLETTFWSRMHDGRSSQAMLQLVDRVKGWRDQGRHIEIVAAGEPDYDAAAVEKAGGVTPYKDSGMAAEIKQALDRGAPVIALMGNFHADYKDLSPLPRPADTGPSVVERLSAASPLLIWVTAAQGQAWVCQGNNDCGAKGLRDGGAAIAHPEVDTASQSSAQVAVVKLRLPAFTPSEPAVKAAESN